MWPINSLIITRKRMKKKKVRCNRKTIKGGCGRRKR
jgi:hypothetical protein